MVGESRNGEGWQNGRGAYEKPSRAFFLFRKCSHRKMEGVKDEKSLVVAALRGAVCFFPSGRLRPQVEYEIGIMQLADHPALNAARDGFIEALQEEGFVDGENISLNIQNAHGEIATASTIAEGFVADQVDLILAIATGLRKRLITPPKRSPS